jgi:hypothetical protein
VTDHSSIDLDQGAIEAALLKVPVAYDEARSIYAEGGNSRSYSVLTVPALAIQVPVGMSVTATGEDGNLVSGTVYLDAAQGSTHVSVLYDVSEVQADHVRCRVGGLPAERQRTDGCIDISRPVIIGGNAMAVRLTATSTAALMK